MFKLQRLEITGFKSFADYTEIVFTGNGITAVVGPNGCGKSNVSESIAWVLGEQRAKALRGSEMKDVVFQGTRTRKPSGMAEVVLHLVRDEETFFTGDEADLSDFDEALSELDENAVSIEEIEAHTGSHPPANGNGGLANGFHAEGSNGFHPEEANGHHTENGNGFHSETVETAQAVHALPVQVAEKKAKSKRHWRPRSFALDFAPGEAISVTRRLYLSGESEYLLNGKTCRLRDIQDLFAGTGLSGAHYAIIEQGRIGQILSAKPADRRSLIEEAAGISKFRTRQRAAEARLEGAKTNLNRISDIVSEIDKQVNSLRRQAAKTRRYKTMREEFRELLRKLFAAEGQHLTELVNDLEEKLGIAAAKEREIIAQVAAKDEEFRTATQKAREAEERLAEMRQQHADNALERDRNQRELKYKQEQIDGLRQRSARLRGEIDIIEQRLALFKTETERLRKDEQKERSEAERAEIALREAEKKHQAKVQELRRIETELETVRSQAMQHTAAVERFAEIGRQLENNLERLKERAEGLRREGDRAETAFVEHADEVVQLQKNVAEKRHRLAELHDEKKQLLVQAGEARTLVKAAEKSLGELKHEFSRKRNRLETLQELDEKRAIYAPAVQKLFAEQAKIGVKFLGTLADRLVPDARAEKAVESLFGSYLQAILVETDEEARKTVKYLRENKLGRIAILVLGSPPAAGNQKKSGGSEKEKTAKIAHLLGVSDDLAALLTEVFPNEMSAGLVENFDEAPATSEKNLVSSDGELFFGGRLFVAGKAQANEKNSSLLAFKRELRELHEQSEHLKEQIEIAEKEAETARRVLAGKEEQIVDLQSLIVQVERELLGLEIQEKTARQETERAERHKKVVADEITQIEKEIAEIGNRRQEARVNGEKAEAARTQASESLAAISRRLSEARDGTEVENAALNERRTLAAMSEERRRSALNALRRVENERVELESRFSRQNAEIVETEEKISELARSIAGIGEKLASAETEQNTEQNELSAATAHLKDAREAADAMSTQLAELNRKSAEARDERAALEVKQTEAVTKLRSLNENCSHELNLSLVELVENEEIGESFDLQAARSQAEDLRDKLENFGAINMLALEELAEAEERLSFLTSQRQDIIDSIATAEEALREIKQRSRERFKEAFEAINANFTEFFQELFGGGRGEMTMIEAEDVLEAGIEIVAQPPGKRLQNILLLSGGEKAMTAIALVMAIFRYRPAPFCLLDEVDAPLDEANVARFVNKIGEMAEKTQFIVITHNKRTMEAARALYGVTMQEAGVSKVVSVRFE